MRLLFNIPFKPECIQIYTMILYYERVMPITSNTATEFALLQTLRHCNPRPMSILTSAMLAQ